MRHLHPGRVADLTNAPAVHGWEEWSAAALSGTAPLAKTFDPVRGWAMWGGALDRCGERSRHAVTVMMGGVL